MLHNEMIALLEAQRDGRELQCRFISAGGKWVEVTGNPLSFMRDWEYRIKPEPTKSILVTRTFFRITGSFIYVEGGPREAECFNRIMAERFPELEPPPPHHVSDLRYELVSRPCP